MAVSRHLREGDRGERGPPHDPDNDDQEQPRGQLSLKLFLKYGHFKSQLMMIYEMVLHLPRTFLSA